MTEMGLLVTAKHEIYALPDLTGPAQFVHGNGNAAGDSPGEPPWQILALGVIDDNIWIGDRSGLDNITTSTLGRTLHPVVGISSYIDGDQRQMCWLEKGCPTDRSVHFHRDTNDKRSYQTDFTDCYSPGSPVSMASLGGDALAATTGVVIQYGGTQSFQRRSFSTPPAEIVTVAADGCTAYLITHEDPNVYHLRELESGEILAEWLSNELLVADICGGQVVYLEGSDLFSFPIPEEMEDVRPGLVQRDVLEEGMLSSESKIVLLPRVDLERILAQD